MNDLKIFYYEYIDYEYIVYEYIAFEYKIDGKKICLTNNEGGFDGRG